MKTRAMACLIVLAAAAAAPAAIAAPAPQATDDVGGSKSDAQISKEDRDFFENAAQGGLLQVKLGRVVAERGSSDEVKHFAQRMIDDHDKINAQLSQVAQKLGLKMPTDLDKNLQQEVDHLSGLHGSDLDRAYMSDMVNHHEDDVKAFAKEAKDGKDPSLRSFAAGALPTLDQHLNLARRVDQHLTKQQ